MHRFLTLLVVAGLLGGAIGQDARDQRRPGPLEAAARQVERELAARAAADAATDARLERLEALARPPAPDPDPGPDPPRPPRPRPDPTTPPQTEPLRASWHFELKDGSTVVGAALAADGLLEAQAGPLWLTVVWEDFDGDGFDEEDDWTGILANAQEGRGTVRWRSLELRVNGEPVLAEAAGAMIPRGALLRSSIDLDDWRAIPDAEPVPEFFRGRALAELENSRKAWVGPYRFFVDERTPDAQGGRAVAIHHGGSEDWLAACAEGRAYRWAEALGAMHRPIHMRGKGGAPWRAGVDGGRYWWDASAMQLAPASWGWGADQGWAYETALRQQVIADISHGGRWRGAVASLAHLSRGARYLLVNVCWEEVRRSYPMEREVPPTRGDIPDDDLYAPLWEILELIAPAPSPRWGNRREAHAIATFAEAAPYLPADVRELYAAAWSTFLARQVDRFGRADFSFTGDVVHSGVPAPAAMHFQQGLLAGAASKLGTPEALDAAARIARWWGTKPPYFAHTGGSFRTATAAPHAGWAHREYTFWTHPETVDFQAVVDDTIDRMLTQGAGLGESLLDCVPRGRRSW